MKKSIYVSAADAPIWEELETYIDKNNDESFASILSVLVKQELKRRKASGMSPVKKKEITFLMENI